MEMAKKLLKAFLLRIVPSILAIGVILAIVKWVVIALLPESIISAEQNRMIRFSISTPILIVIYVLERRYWFKTFPLKMSWRQQISLFGGYFVSAALVLCVVTLILLVSCLILIESRPVGCAGISYIMIVMIFTVLLEEVIFRGIFYGELRKVVSWKILVPLVGVIFGLVHIANSGTNFFSVFSATLGGVILSLMYERYRSIVAPYAFHLGWNVYQAVIGSSVSGTEFASYTPMVMKFNGPYILTGSPGGLESSVITLIFLILLTGWLVRGCIRDAK